MRPWLRAPPRAPPGPPILALALPATGGAGCTQHSAHLNPASCWM